MKYILLFLLALPAFALDRNAPVALFEGGTNYVAGTYRDILPTTKERGPWGQVGSNPSKAGYATLNRFGVRNITHFVVPEGMAIIPGTRSINSKGVENYETETIAKSAVRQQAEKDAQHDRESPDNGWDNFSQREQFFLRVMYRLARQDAPNLTLEQFRKIIRQDWDASRTEKR
ncbi:hypothetical protein N9204_00360 [bacterium]|nr:hypothetical protein [bacterium]